MHYTLTDVVNAFDDKTLGRAQGIVARGLVQSADQLGDVIEGSVQGSGDWDYEQDIELYAGTHGVEFEGSCSCPVGHMCKHMAAVLLTCLQQEEVAPLAGQVGGDAGTMTLPNAVAAWLQRVEGAAHGRAAAPLKSGAPAKTTYRLLFVLSPDRSGKHVILSLCKARLRVNGEIAAASTVGDLYNMFAAPPSYLQAGDEDALRLLVALRSGFYGSADVEPKGRVGAQLLSMLLESQQLQWANSLADMQKGQLYPVKAGPARTAELVWLEEDERLRLGWQFQPASDGQREPERGSIDYILPTEPVLYVNNLVCGTLTLQQGGAGIPLRELQAMVAQAPTLAARDKLAVSHVLLAQGLQHIVPLPQQLQETVRDDITPQPQLLLGALPQELGGTRDASVLWQDFALPSFDYDGNSVAADHAELLIRRSGQGIEKIARQRAAEDAALAILQAAGLTPPQDAAPPLSTLAGALVMPSQLEWLRFASEVVPALEAQGWQVSRMPDYRFDVAEVEDWYADIDEQASEAGSPWFDLELGIMVNQARVSLLPVLIDLIRNAPQDFNPQALAAHADDEPLLATLPDGVRVALPWGRIKPILGTLGELYFSDKTGDSMRLSALDAARLAELAAATQLRWIGGQRLRDLGQKLANFGGVQSVAAPRGLQATLRDYQSEGLAWMQFLREFDLAGILADDMGLGKTIQTLAHILTEKEAGRLTQPALVVAPTSLMGNWQDEAARFAPGLRLLVLQGKERLAQFDAIGQFDLVLTTYALLPRDEEKLRQHAYHLVILDESHYIKNNRSKAAQAAGMLRARHRLCLTGTPLENHLGELWSQFHFLLPGLLGEEKAFNAAFRHPIEKQGDDGRRALLVRRIKPFLLRRTKDKVAKELPAKTEMLRTVELSGAQRDLYETVRLAMDQKVRAEIARKGVARSQIVILEALLKLRQVCCDPRLVKSESVKKAAAPSAKLLELMTMIEELLEEGRKILVFSSFTSMLALIEAELQARQVPYALLTGDTDNRAEVVRAFQQGLVPIFLISLKAGGVGLNLTAADTVIHYDPWWNPAAENQATDRAWRIGQDKPVFVYKLIARGTLEEKIQVLQQKKAELAQAMLNAGEGRSAAISQEDLQAIFAPLEE
ncbi:DEAD/DEAH box helicase [Herminiimonas sp. CN]|uniref:DEAD/DEAH box helicase n=1 Tax=Herminiimonas sp. CN TaxID=1349818 RepID=UPI0005591F7A|nr:DEAD/DEAH box helicase [Herminiimonas sp. CN]